MCEVDVLAEADGLLAPREIKSGTTLAGDRFKAINQWSTLAERDRMVAIMMVDVDGDHEGVVQELGGHEGG